MGMIEMGWMEIGIKQAWVAEVGCDDGGSGDRGLQVMAVLRLEVVKATVVMTLSEAEEYMAVMAGAMVVLGVEVMAELMSLTEMELEMATMKGRRTWGRCSVHWKFQTPVR